MKTPKGLIAFIFLLAFFAPRNVYSYIDAGTGSLMLQMLIAGIVGSLFALKLFFKRIVNWIRKVFGKKELPPPETSK